jgi:hypothetical protein
MNERTEELKREALEMIAAKAAAAAHVTTQSLRLRRFADDDLRREAIRQCIDAGLVTEHKRYVDDLPYLRMTPRGYDYAGIPRPLWMPPE